MNGPEILTESPLDSQSVEQLVPLVYEQLRRVAANKLAGGAAAGTLEPAELVHEAWLRMCANTSLHWNDRQHFFAIAAEAMRRILVDHTRREYSRKRGSGLKPEELNETSLIMHTPPEELLAVDDALIFLETEDAQAAELVKLRYFVGLTMEETAAALGIPKRTAESIWTNARAWLHREIRKRL